MSAGLLVRKFFGRWYIKYLLLPYAIPILLGIVVQVLASSIFLTVIVTLSISNIIIAFELVSLYKKHNYEISRKDRAIIKKLIRHFERRNLREDFKEHDAWYGYKQKLIYSLADFRADSSKLSNRLKDEEIQRLVDNVAKALDDFSLTAGNHLFPNGQNSLWFVFSEEVFLNPKKRRRMANELNQLSNTAYWKIQRLILHLKKRDVI